MTDSCAMQVIQGNDPPPPPARAFARHDWCIVPIIATPTPQETYNEREVRDVIKVLVDVVVFLHARGIVSTKSENGGGGS